MPLFWEDLRRSNSTLDKVVSGPFHVKQNSCCYCGLYVCVCVCDYVCVYVCVHVWHYQRRRTEHKMKNSTASPSSVHEWKWRATSFSQNFPDFLLPAGDTDSAHHLSGCCRAPIGWLQANRNEINGPKKKRRGSGQMLWERLQGKTNCLSVRALAHNHRHTGTYTHIPLNSCSLSVVQNIS